MREQKKAISRQPSAISKDIALNDKYIILNDIDVTLNNNHVTLNNKDVTLNLIQGPFFSWIPSQARNDVVADGPGDPCPGPHSPGHPCPLLSISYYASGSQSIPKHDIHQSLSLASDCLLPKPTPQVSRLDHNSPRSTSLRQSPKLGCLPYLNVKPLVYPFEHGRLPDGWELVYAPPSRLARMLAEGRIAAAPVSSFASLSNPNFAIVPGICISSDGPVTSVLMLSKVELKDVKTVAADTSSLSGRALLRIVLSENYGLEPEYVDCEPKLEKMLSMCDAALIIGDPAMLCDKTGLNILDLGEEWLNLTGLPAVFATWAGPKESITPELIAVLASAKEEGLKRTPKIAEEQAPILGLPHKLCEEYLAKVIRYDLGQREIESLRIFGQKAFEHGLIGFQPEVNVVEE
ncbi:MAG: menaquinone biosynthesis protein [Armatimonadota bacterium]